MESSWFGKGYLKIDVLSFVFVALNENC